MKTTFLIGIATVLLFLAGAALFAGRDGERVGSPSPSPTRQRGVTLSPQSFQADDLSTFFTLAAEAGDVVSWHAPWGDLSPTTGGGNFLQNNSAKYGYTPVVVVHNAKSDNAGLAKPFDEATKEDYTKRAVDFVTKYKPAYFGIGIEINRMALKAPQDFEAYAAFFPEVVRAVKAASPETEVFTTFELNTMKGLNGGLFGGSNDPTKNQWQLLEKFAAADFFAWSVYPGLIYKSPADIPDDYLTEISSHTSKPIAFTEIGWHSAASPKGWEGSEAEQAEFVRRFFELSKDLDYHFAVWSFLFDQDTIEPFKTMGLRTADKAKAAWRTWVDAEP